MASVIIFTLVVFSPSLVKGLFQLNVTQQKYEAEVNANITLEWRFTGRTVPPLDSLHVYCSLLSSSGEKTVLDVREGVELRNRHQDFSGRVSCDRDGLRQGRISLHLSTLRREDSGTYLCEVQTPYGVSRRSFLLNVTEHSSPKSISTKKHSPFLAGCILFGPLLAVAIAMYLLLIHKSLPHR